MLGIVYGLALVAATQGTFEGAVAGIFKTDGKSIPFRYQQLGSRLRQEYTIENMSFITLYDGTTGDMITIMPQQKQYMKQNMRTASGPMRGLSGGGQQKAPDLTKTKVTDLGRSETIAGRRCDHYRFENLEDKDHGTFDICGAKGLGFMGMPGDVNGMMPSTIQLLRSQNPALVKLAREGFFPLRMTINNKKNQKIEWEVTQLDLRRPDASLFQPPAGYKPMQMPGMGGKP